MLISNYTQTLDLFEKLCRNKKCLVSVRPLLHLFITHHSKRYEFFRLDGTMTIVKRQKLVDQFNDPNGKEFVFLLSSKAGGCGINLIGANRLILFDPGLFAFCAKYDMLKLNFQTGTRQQINKLWLVFGVMVRRKNVCISTNFLGRCCQSQSVGFVYRFISTGTIEEKIFQRQANKQALSSAVVDEKEDTERHFSVDALRQLFTLNQSTLCETHETFKCKRCKDGKQIIKAPALLYGDAST